MLKRKLVLFLLIAGGLLWSTAAVFANGQKEASAGTKAKTTLAVVFRSLSNPYQVEYKVGAEALSKRLGGNPVDVLVSNADSQKELSEIKAEVAKTGGNVVFYIDPNSPTDDAAIANILDQAHVYYVTWWNKPADLKVWDHPYWVAHISFDGVAAGEYTADQLFKTFPTPGKGNIIALQGTLSNSPAKERFQGLQNALSKNPGVHLLQWEAADWDRNKAYSATKAMLVAHPNVDGVWTANDDMALGAIQALKEAGLAGKVKVTGHDGISEMFDAIKNGDAAATVLADGKYQSELGLSMALAAKEGKLDVASMPHKHRQFEITAIDVNSQNVDQVIQKYVKNTPNYDLTDFFSKFSRAIP